MRAIICSSNFPNPEEPNKGIFIFRQAKAMIGKAESAVVAPVPYFPPWLPHARYGRYARIPSQASLDGVEVHYPRVLVTPRTGRQFYGAFYAAGMLPSLARLVRRRRPDTLIAFWAYPDGFATLLLSRLFRLPVVIGVLGCDVNYPEEFAGKRTLVSWTLRGSAGVMAVSRALADRVTEFGVEPGRIGVIPNGLDDVFLQEARAPGAECPKGEARAILYCGRLSPEKGVGDLMAAARILFKRRKDVRLTIVGDGPMRDQVIRWTEQWKIADRVTLAGEERHDRIPDRMRDADVLCLPSHREGWPNVLTEALACGLPIVATRVGGVPEIVTGDDLGLLVPPGSPDALADALSRAIDRTWNRQRLRDAVKDRSWGKVVDEVLAFTRKAIQ